MNDRPLTLELAREGRRLKASIVEGGDKALRPYEIHEVDWQQVENSCREVLNILRRSNGSARPSSEILVSLKKSGQFLYDLLVPPQAKEKLAATGANILTLRLEDTLVHIPWELLYNGREFLCRRFAVGRIASTCQTSPSAPFNALVIADPRGDLEAAYREGLEIKAFLDQRRDAFQVDFKSHPVNAAFVRKNLRDYDIVHYAGHADYHPQNPCESSWLLADGKLRANEVCAMGGLQPMPALVFSNACQSGHSTEWNTDDGERIFGLANAYLLAGVQHYIGTHCEVLDETSAYFARQFYRFLAEDISVGEALRRSRNELIQAYGEETLAWASYLLYGDPAFTFSLNSSKPVTTEARGSPGEAAPRVDALLLAPRKLQASRWLYLSLIIALLTAAYLGLSLLNTKSSEQNFASLNTAQQSTSFAAKEKAEQIGAKTEAGGMAAESASVAKSMLANESSGTNSAASLNISMNVIGQRKQSDGSYREVLVSEGSLLRSHDNFQVHVESSRPAYLYVLLYDSQGHASQLFPDAKRNQSAFVSARNGTVVPDRDIWFWLDENRGTETIYVLASAKPLADIGALLVKMEAADEADKKQLSDEIKQGIETIQRGVGGITKGQTVTYTLSDGKKIQRVTEVVAGTGAVVRTVSFQHR